MNINNANKQENEGNVGKAYAQPGPLSKNLINSEALFQADSASFMGSSEPVQVLVDARANVCVTPHRLDFLSYTDTSNQQSVIGGLAHGSKILGHEMVM